MCLLMLPLLCLLASCNAIKIGYDHGGTIAYWWLDSYIDIGREQKPWLRDDIDALLAWHRQSQLPDYARLLRLAQQQLGSQASSPIDAAVVLADLELIRRSADPLLERALPMLADLALSLQERQLQHLAHKFDDKNADYRKKYLRGEARQRQQAAYEHVLEQAEFWFGSFSREQQKQIRAASDARPPTQQWWLEQRIAHQQAMLAMLETIRRDKPARELVVARLRQYARAQLDGPADARQKAIYDAYSMATAQMTVSIVKLTTAAQKAHAVQRMQDLIDDCTSLSKPAPVVRAVLFDTAQ